MLTPFQLLVRGELTSSIAELGHSPTNDALAMRLGCTVGESEGDVDR